MNHLYEVGDLVMIELAKGNSLGAVDDGPAIVLSYRKATFGAELIYTVYDVATSETHSYYEGWIKPFV